MSSATMERIVTQRIANATKAIVVYEANPYSRIDKTIDGPEVKAKDEIIASTWNLVDRSLTSAKIRPLSGIVPSTIDTKPNARRTWSLRCYHRYRLVDNVPRRDHCDKKVVRIPPLGDETLTNQSNKSNKYASIVASEQRAELFDRIGTLERDNLRLGGMLCVERNRVDRLRRRVIRFSKRGKLDPRYIRPFKFISKVGTIAYRLELPEKLSRVHRTFHVVNLKKCLADEPLAIPLDEIQVDNKLHFIKEPFEIMDREVKCLKQSRILIVKVHWNSRRGPEFTWEREYQMQTKYIPAPFHQLCTRGRGCAISFEDKALLTGKECHNP
ncbi:hypothetical protein Tco_0570364 [Tanacetum coccineum]